MIIINVDEMKRGKEMIPPFHFINLKCDPEKALSLREKQPAVQPAWHQNKKHWNSIYTDGSLSDQMIYELMDHSYDLVVDSFTGKLKQELAKLSNS